MTAAKIIAQKTSLRKALHLTGISNTKWYHAKTPRDVLPNKTVIETVQRIGTARPTYGTRRMAAAAAAASRELYIPVDCKQIRRIFHTGLD